MPLIPVKGSPRQVNKFLLFKAFEETPSLIIDCGNSADAHALFPSIKEEQLHDAYVVNAEAIYRFRDALRRIPRWQQEFNFRRIIVTTIHVLYSYDDPEENYNVLEHCWEIMKELSDSIEVYVGIAKDKMHSEFADRFSEKIVQI